MQVLKQQLHVLWEIALRRPTAHVAFLYDKNYRKIYHNDACFRELWGNIVGDREIYHVFNIRNHGVKLQQLPSAITYYHKLPKFCFFMFDNSYRVMEWYINNKVCCIKYKIDKSNYLEERIIQHSLNYEQINCISNKSYGRGGKKRKHEEVDNKFKRFVDIKGVKFTSYDDMRQFFWENNK